MSIIKHDQEPVLEAEQKLRPSALSQLAAQSDRERTLGWICADLQKKIKQSKSAGAKLNFAVCFERGAMAVVVYRFGRFVRATRIPVLRQLLGAIYYALFYLTQMFTGISIQSYAKVGPRFVVNNFSGIFVLAESIGADFTVCEGVTVGNIRGKSRLAIIGNNVYLEPGCKVLGDITIGDNVVVRANSLVLSDVPSNSLVIGNPARIMSLPVEAGEQKSGQNT